MKILSASSELFPIIKTGGLADVALSLPAALRDLNHDVRLMLPAYRGVLEAVNGAEPVGTVQLANPSTRLLRTTISGLDVWLVEHALFNRPGNPYLADDGKPWPDNAARFALFCRAIAAIALDRAGLGWQPDVLHCHDWQTALAPALLASESERPATVYTIHNLAYQGVFPRATFVELGLPDWQWSPDGLEFYGQLSFMKGGLRYADRLTTVSPGYAREIQTEAFGCGLDGLLAHRRNKLRGIVNGIDTAVWNPATDPLLAQNYGCEDLRAKHANKTEVQRAFGLAERRDVMLIGMIGRLVAQKGIDLVLDALPPLLELPVQIALLGAGEFEHEQALRAWETRQPAKLSVHLGFDEALAHRIEAGADVFLMPSRFEPCGLNQMYSQRYGTIPIVRRTGGLQDTVEDANDQAIAAGRATGIVFDEATAAALIAAVRRALALHENKRVWRQLQQTGMRRDFSWERSAVEYLQLYEQALFDSHGMARKTAD